MASRIVQMAQMRQIVKNQIAPGLRPDTSNIATVGKHASV